MPNYFAVVPAAGSGTRFDATLPKQYASLADRPVIDHTLDVLCRHPLISRVIVALAENDTHWKKTAASRHPRVRTVAGGKERCNSVLHGLEFLDAAPKDWILVHDAVRPCLRDAELSKLTAALQDDPVGGLLAIPVQDTLKCGDADSARVVRTLDRTGLWQAQTPQMFRFDILLKAIRTALQAQLPITDEAHAVEQLGKTPRLIHGSVTNLKITTPHDLHIATALLQLRQSETQTLPTLDL